MSSPSAVSKRFGLLLCSGIVLYLMTFAYSLVQVSIGRGSHQHDKCDQHKGYVVSLRTWLAVQGFVNCGMVVCLLVIVALYKTFKRNVIVVLASVNISLYTLWLSAWVPTGFIQLINHSHECLKMEHTLYTFTYGSLFVGLLLIILNPILAYFMLRYILSSPEATEQIHAHSFSITGGTGRVVNDRTPLIPSSSITFTGGKISQQGLPSQGNGQSLLASDESV